MDGRDKWASEMREYGYVEFPSYLTTSKNYCCANCPYMIDNLPGGVPTNQGFKWCKKFDFPDRPEGCCDGWAPK